MPNSIFVCRFFEWKRTKEGKQPYFIYFPRGSPDTKPDVKPETKPDMKTEPIKPESDPQSSSEPGAKLDAVHIKQDPDAVRPTLSSSGESAAPKKELKQEIKTEPEEADALDDDGETRKAFSAEGAPMKQTKDAACSEAVTNPAQAEDEGTLPQSQLWLWSVLSCMLGYPD